MNFTNIIKASQRISSELRLDQLLVTLIKIFLEYSGAERGCLILETDGDLFIQAEGKIDGDRVDRLQSIPLDPTQDQAYDQLPSAIIQHVDRTQEWIVLHHASEEGRFTTDPYIRHTQLQSLLCAPLVYQNQRCGILYLEHQSTAGTFTSERVEGVHGLATQAAIALNNACLFKAQIDLNQSLNEDYRDRKQAEQPLKAVGDELDRHVQDQMRDLGTLNASLQAEIAKRQAAEQQLETLAAELKCAKDDLEQFASVVSHDLREPLRMIEGYIQLLEQKYQTDLDAAVQGYIAYITDGTSRMRQLLQDLVAYARIDSRGNIFKPVDCMTVVSLALHQLQGAIQASNATINYTGLPSVKGDLLQLAQLFQNLIGNAIKFRQEQPIEIIISADLSGQSWLFKVQDNGVGVNPRYLKRIFEVFSRLHPRKEYSGTGIGLAICEKIVHRHGGKIWAESQPGVGTTIFFTLPHLDNQ